METGQKLEISKEYNVPAEQLYRAWISEEDLKAWWHPMGNDLVEVTNEVQEGGAIKYVFQSKEGTHSFTITGEYKEVKEGQRLVYTWNWEVPENTIGHSTYVLTISFNDLGDNRSRLEVVQDDFKAEESVLPHKEGWEASLQDLEQHLSGAQ